jgi:hypothetical protein
MVNGQSSCTTHEKENSASATSQSEKRFKLHDATYARKSRVTEGRAACDEKKRTSSRKLEEREAAGALAQTNCEEKAKRDAEQLKARQELGRLQAEQRRKPEVAAQEAPQRQRIAADGQREQKVRVAFCLQCTGTFVPLAALVCPDLSSAAALQKAKKEAERLERIAAFELMEQKVRVAFCLQCGTGTFLALAALVQVCTSFQRCSASAADTVCRGFQAAAEKADKEAQRLERIAANERMAQKVWVAFWHWHLPCSRGACVS